MSLDSPIASEADSLTEERPQNVSPENNTFERGQINYSTFTRHRPTILHRNKERAHRQSLLSPQSVDNLDVDDAQTPEFAMTQSMYEPNGKKEQIEKMNQQCKLMNLIASEKATLAAQKRKMKEMKLKVAEQKRRNEERQKIVDERRIRMLAEEEEKKRRIINKIGKSTNMTCSVMTQSISVKNKMSSNSKFLANRPLSSTGKVFGFGSSTPRYTCNPIKHEKINSNNSSYFLLLNKNTMPATRMCSSQIMYQTSHNETKIRSEKNPSTNVSKSTFNISEIKKLESKNERVTSNNNIFNKFQKPTPRSIKHLQPNSKVEVSQKNSNYENSRICLPIKEVTISTKLTKLTLGPERHASKPLKIKLAKMPVGTEKEKKSILRSDNNKINSKNERSSIGSNKKEIAQIHNSQNIEYDQDVERKPEVRFVTGSEISSKNCKENVDQSSEKRTSIIKEVSDDEYKQRMALQRKLAREKKVREEIERKSEKEKETPKVLLEVMSPVDTSISTESEISINILPNDQLQKETSVTKIESIASGYEVKQKEVTLSIPNIEISKEKEELTSSTDELDRLARKKRLESIMSRVKKLPSGSTENVNHQMTTSALQNMMEKGHLTGMSKTAAVLMRNAHRSSDFGSSNLDVQGSTETIRTSVSMDNLQNDENDAPISRGDCDGKEDSQKEIHPNLETKSNIMQNLSTTTENSYLSSWKDKYSISDSLDSETDNAI